MRPTTIFTQHYLTVRVEVIQKGEEYHAYSYYEGKLAKRITMLGSNELEAIVAAEAMFNLLKDKGVRV